MKLLKKLQPYLWMLILLFAISCSRPDAKHEAEKITNKQVKKMEQQQEAIDEIFDKVQGAKDSLLKHEQNLHNEKSRIKNEMGALDTLKLNLASTLKENEQKKLITKKAEIQEKYKELKDSLFAINNKLDELSNQKEKLDIKEDQVKDQQKQAKMKLVTGIDEIDKRLYEIEKQSLVKQKELDINMNKIDLSKKKIALLKDEKNLYLREKNEIIKNDEDDTKLESLNLKIKDLDNNIKSEEGKISHAENAIQSTKSWLSDVEVLKAKLRDMMKNEYDKNETITQFTKDETERLKKEENLVINEANLLDSLKTKIAIEKNAFDSMLATIDKKIELVKGKKLSEILAEKSQLEVEEATLSGNEANMMHEKSQVPKASSDTVYSTEMNFIENLEKEITAKKQEVQNLKKEIALDRKEMAKKQAEIDAKRSRNVKALSATLVTVIILSFILIIVLYYLGKRKRKMKKS